MKRSDETQDFLKIEKLNQDMCNDVLSETKKLNKKLDGDIADTETFIAAVEARFGIDSSYAPNTMPQTSSKIDVKKKSWEELCAEANDAYPEKVRFEDLLTKEEFENAYRRLDEINAEFSRRTGFKKVDWIFLATATALQCVRQYVLDPYLKNHRPSANPNDEKGRKNNAEPGWYHADTDKILISKVPFDAIRYSGYSTVEGFLKGGNHRYVTLGHDPILGWVFGTANIMTNTLTRYDFQSAHVKYVPGKGNVIYSLADTDRIFLACKERIFDEGMDGKLAVGSAVVREAIHLKSDIGTKLSLPIPGISAIASPQFAQKLSEWGIDTASVGTEMALSATINMLVAMVHRLFYDESVDDAKMFEVRTRKILLYSNLIASTSNVIVACIMKNPEVLDVGGLLVMITRLFSDIRFIARIKQEFIDSQLEISFQGIADEVDALYRSI